MKIHAIDRQGKEHTLEGRDGWTVMEILRDGGLDIAAECGGACACATCHVYVDPAFLPLLDPIDEEQEEMLGATAAERKSNSRLSCQIRMKPEFAGLIVCMPDRQY